MLSTKADQDANHLQAESGQNMEDSLIKSIQSSTRALIGSFRDKTKLLSNCPDLNLLLRKGYDRNRAAN
jgi:hypothetical protein